ncbi:hypothetical protein VF21_10144 [Pseudogymnoascus sp. 05NY08]|nr:hypothetical protein VF21_10144 [Pseudogymnoascus sp. 05NY08]
MPSSGTTLGAGQYPSPTPYEHFYAPEQVFSNQSEGDATFQFQAPSNANHNGSSSSVAGAATAMQVSMDTSLYPPNFDSFFNVPNLGSTFATFAFSDSQAFPGSEVPYNSNPVHGNALLQGSSGMHASPLNIPSNGNKAMPIASSPRARDSQAQITAETDLLPLKDDTRAYLITYFKRSTRPPASLVSVDPAGWYQMQQYLLRTASSHSVVMDALLALTQLISVRESTLRSSSSSQWRMVFELQQRSCRELGERRVDEKSQNALLAAIFLLAWFEVICDEQDAHRSNFPTDLAESVIRGSARWNSASRRLLQWLNSFDAKASHMGGRQLLTPKSLEVVLQHRFERSYRTVDSGDSENETVSNDSEEDDRNGSAAVFTQARKRRASSRSFTTRSFITPREIKMNVFNAIMQPALEFHLVSQSYSRKIGTHDRHHRSRNTVEDEYEVVTACKTIDTELKYFGVNVRAC